MEPVRTRLPQPVKATENICIEAECHAIAFCRGLCRRCYMVRNRAGTLPPKRPELPLFVHSLTDVDYEAKTATCSICGPAAAVSLRTGSTGSRSGNECVAKRLEVGRR